MDLRQLDPALAVEVREAGNFDMPTTLEGAVVEFFSHGTPQFIALMFFTTLLARFACFGAPTLGDGVTAAAVGAFWIVQEWAIHDKLLHSTESWFGSEIHGFHHDLPYYHISIDGLGLALSWFLAAAAALLLVMPSLPLALVAMATYTLMGGVYEFCHFIAHTRVPLRGYLQDVRKHHMNHHVLNSEYWLAFTCPDVDRAFATAPDPRKVRKMDFSLPRNSGRVRRSELVDQVVER